jgi:acetyltransferase-like isoleucine patch superfamily enzyme
VKKQRVAIFGVLDSLAGRLVELLAQLGKHEIVLFVSVKELPNLDVHHEHRVRPHDRTEFPLGNTIFGKEIFVGCDYINRMREMQIEACFVIEDDQLLRSQIIEKLNKNGIEVLSYVDRSTTLGGKNRLGIGTIIFPNCYLGYKSDTEVGSIVQPGCLIEHHSVIGSYVNINPRLTTGGFVKIEDFAQINISVEIVNRIMIGKHAIIGAGSLVLENCDPRSLYYGRPAVFVRSISAI